MDSTGIQPGGGHGSSPHSEDKLNSIRTKLHNSRLAQRYRRTKDSIANRAVEEICNRIIPGSKPQPKPKPSKRTTTSSTTIRDGRPAWRSTERRSFIPDLSLPRPRSILKLRTSHSSSPTSPTTPPPQYSKEPPQYSEKPPRHSKKPRRTTTPMSMLFPDLDLPSDLVPGAFPSPPVLSRPARGPAPVSAPPPPPRTTTDSTAPDTKRITAWISDLPPTPLAPPTGPPLRHRSSRSSRRARAPPPRSTAAEVVLSRNNSTASNATTVSRHSHLGRFTDAAIVHLSRPALHLQSSYHRYLFPLIWLVFDLLRATVQFFSSDFATFLPPVCLLCALVGTFWAVDYFIWLVVFWIWLGVQLLVWGSLLGLGAAMYYCGVGRTVEFLLPWLKWALMINAYMKDTSEPAPAPERGGRKASYRAWWEAGKGVRKCSLRL